MGFMGPIIGITGNSVSNFSEYQSAGADLVLSKPINKLDLVAALETTLGPKKNDVAESIELQTVSIDVNERDFRYHKL
jgi:DNA-binding response OmpR family regulator